mgnify:CR=1
DSLLGKLIQVGGFIKSVSIASQFRPAKIVGEDKNNVWFFGIHGQSKKGHTKENILSTSESHLKDKVPIIKYIIISRTFLKKSSLASKSWGPLFWLANELQIFLGDVEGPKPTNHA